MFTRFGSITSKFDGSTVYGGTMSLKTLDRFLDGFDELEFLGSLDISDMIGRPSSYAREFDLVLLFRHLDEAIKPEYHDRCIEQIKQALDNEKCDNVTADQLLGWWEPLYVEGYC